MIDIKNVRISYSYGTEFLIPDLKLEKGKITSIIGRNGSGKSTFLRAVAGISHYKGSIRLDGKELKSISPVVRARRVSYLPQTLKSVNIDVETLAEHGRYPYHGNMRRMSEEDSRLIKNALKITGMQEYASKSLQELSGGERQSAYLSMVIAQNAPLILLDEPTTFMDLQHQKRFFDIVKELKTLGHGIVMVCHNIEQSFAISDLICLMHERTMIKTGTPEEMVKEEELLRKVFGIAVKKSDDPELLYPYVIRK